MAAHLVWRPPMRVSQVPRILVYSVAGVVLGLAIDVVWPQQLLFLAVRTGLGPILAIASACVAVIAIGTILVAGVLVRAKSRERDALARAREWEARSREQDEAHARFMRELDHE